MFSIAKFMYRFRKWQRLFLPFIPLLILVMLLLSFNVHDSLSVYGLVENSTPNMTQLAKVRPDPLLVHGAIIDISPTADEIVTADLDNDGDQDIIFDGSSPSMISDDRVLVWLENVDPDNFIFVPHTMPIDNLAFDVFAADVDGNGRIDIITITDQQLNWHENLGGTPPEFTAHLVTDTLSYGYAVFAEDIDGNGAIDIVTTEQNTDAVTWYQNDGQAMPGFVQHVITNTVDNPVDIFVADADGDADKDIVVAAFNEDSFIWFENDGEETPIFTSHVLTDTADGATSVYMADLNGDTHIDILTASRLDNTVGWFQNDGSKPPVYTFHVLTDTLPSPHTLQVIDLNGDQLPDILLSSGSNAVTSDGEIFWFANDGANLPNFTPHSITNTQGIDPIAFAVNVGNSDNIYHVLIKNGFPYNSTDNVSFLLAQNDSSLIPNFSSRTPILDTSQHAHDIHAADFDNDGDVDPVVAAWGNGISWYEQRSDPVNHFILHPVESFEGSYQGVATGDINGDDNVDIVTTNFSGIIAWHQNDGLKPPSFTNHVISDTANEAKYVHVDDLDGDLDMDVIATLVGPNTLLWFENDGEDIPTFATHIISDTIISPRKLHTGDLDNDGDLDIVATSFGPNNSSNGAMYWFENNGEKPPAFTPHTLVPLVRGAHGTFVADLDNDDDEDVLYTSIDGSVTWLENDGEKPPSFIAHIIEADLERPLFVEAADMDGDGDMDVIVSSRNDNTVAWYENTGLPEPDKFIRHLVSDRVSNVMDIYPVDMDGDTDLDLLTTSIIYGGSGGNVAWWKNRQETLYIPVVQKQE